jgi:Glycosyltransferase family 87
VIGEDLFYTRRASELVFLKGVSPYEDNNHYAYPPFDLIFFSPLLLIDASSFYPWFTLINILSFTVLTFFIPIQISKTKNVSNILLLIFGTGLFSYGLQFELERGQFNVIAATICFISIWLYHHHPKYRIFAYFLFSISIQLKLFPLIFTPMFIHNLTDWKNNIKRITLIIIFNAALLFILGVNTFIKFIKALQEQATSPYIWIGNHSIASFTAQFSTWIAETHSAYLFNINGMQLVLYFLVTILILLIAIQAYYNKTSGVNSYLLLACTLAGLLIPSSSHDYKLSILASPVAIFFSTAPFEKNIRSPFWLSAPLTTFFSFLYSSTLFSYTNKPYYLDNNLPALLLMLFIVVAFSFINKPEYLSEET